MGVLLGTPILFGGEKGIRTLGTVTGITGFQDQLHKPLGHLSKYRTLFSRRYDTILEFDCQLLISHSLHLAFYSYILTVKRKIDKFAL